MIRGLRPTDVWAYIAFRKKAGHSNKALLRPTGRPSPLSLHSFIGNSLSLPPGREIWVRAENGDICGLVGARPRWGAAIWDVDQLISLPDTDCDQTYTHLLHHLCSAACQAGIHKVFLRVDLGCESVRAARQAGFLHYSTEYVYRAHGEYRFNCFSGPELGLRRRKRADDQALFQLYCSSVPASVRQVEGMTIQEWRWTDGWRPQPAAWEKRVNSGRHDYLCFNEKSLVAGLRTDISSRTVSLYVSPERQARAETLVEAALSTMPKGQSVSFVVRDHQTGLRLALESMGCQEVASYALLARIMTVRMMERTLLPLRA